MSDIVILPDAEALVSQWLRTRSEITSLVQQRVHTVIPNEPVFPLLIVRRVGGNPKLNRPRAVDAAILQLDAYGGSKQQAHDLAETACAVIAAEIHGVHNLGVVSGVSFGQFSWLPDDDYSPARPRYVADLILTTHA